MTTTTTTTLRGWWWWWYQCLVIVVDNNNYNFFTRSWLLSPLVISFVVVISITTVFLPPVDAFSSYMTTTSGCLTDLDTTEIIMNHAVQAAAPWDALDRSHMQLVLVVQDDDNVDNNNNNNNNKQPLEWNTNKEAFRRQEKEKKNQDEDNDVPPDRVVVTVPTSSLSSSSTSLWIQVQGSVPDAQYVIQVEGGTLHGGLCDNHARYTGRVNDAGVALQWTHDDDNNNNDKDGVVQVWAGWAAGHEAVQLLPGYILRRQGNNNNNNNNDGDVKNSPMSLWIDQMATPVACTSIQLSETPVQVLERRVVMQQSSTDKKDSHLRPQVTLHLAHDAEIHEDGMYDIELVVTSNDNDNNNKMAAAMMESVAVSVTAGARFTQTFHTAQLACQGERVLWSTVPPDSTSFVVGTIQVDIEDDEQDVHLQVRALYTIVGQEEPDVLYMTPALHIRHVQGGRMDEVKEQEDKNDNVMQHANQHDGEETQQGGRRRVDPQKEMEKDLKHVKQASDLANQIKNHLANKPNGGGEKIGAAKEQEAQHRQAHGDKQGDSKPKHYHGHTNHVELKDDKYTEKYLEHRREWGHGQAIDAHKMKQKLTATNTAEGHMEAKNHHYFKQLLHGGGGDHFEGIPMMEEKEFPTVSYDTAYLSALLFLVGSTVATIQICKCASARGSKGRFDL